MAGVFTQRFTEEMEPGGNLYPDSRAAGTYNTEWLLMSNRQRAVFPLLVGEMQAGSTIDMLLQEANTAAGGGAQAIAGKAITQITQAAGGGDDNPIIEIKGEELDVNNGYEYVRAQIVVAGAAVEFAVMPLRFIQQYPPPSVAGWTEVVD